MDLDRMNMANQALKIQKINQAHLQYNFSMRNKLNK